MKDLYEGFKCNILELCMKTADNPEEYALMRNCVKKEDFISIMEFHRYRLQLLFYKVRDVNTNSPFNFDFNGQFDYSDTLVKSIKYYLKNGVDGLIVQN